MLSPKKKSLTALLKKRACSRGRVPWSGDLFTVGIYFSESSADTSQERQPCLIAWQRPDAGATLFPPGTPRQEGLLSVCQKTPAKGCLLAIRKGDF